jgi:hypothetical protein
MAASTLERLSAAAMRGLGRFGRGTTAAASRAAAAKLEQIGLQGIGYHSTDEELADWEDRLWHDQDDLVDERAKEWQQHLHYCANEQFIAYHKDRRQWIPRRTVPWRIRASYNVVQKAVNLRVARLTENKPTVSVQAATGSMADVEKAEYKESLFWYLWEELHLHLAIVRARRWATKCGAGFLKVGWDLDAGGEYPVTRKRPRYETVMVPQTDPATGQEIPGAPPVPTQVYVGIEEVYLDARGNELGPVEAMEDDPETGTKRLVRAPVPEDADTYYDGQAFCDVRSPFNIRYDKYVDDPSDSWYIQDAEILPGSKILAMLPDIADKLAEARPASEDDKAIQWNGLRPRSTAAETGSGLYTRAGDPGSTSHTPIDKEYLVRETWIFPKNAFLRKQWGKKGALLIAVGGVLVAKLRLPEWALKACPFIQFADIPEEGNHYAKSFLRDLIPVQDDINRSRSQMAERAAILSRLILGAPMNHGINFRVLTGFPGALLTYRSPQHMPTPISLGNADPSTREFYDASLVAAQDLGNMNDASTGRLPSAGIAAKAIYALQYAEERSISETSTLQDIALKRLAKALDWITRVEYKEARKVRITGADRSYLVEREILPEHLDSDVDYFFTPGSMVARQKEAVKNELLTLYGQGLIDQATVKKYLSSAVPEAFRQSYDLQEAKIKRTITKVLRKEVPEGQPLQPDPWDDPRVGKSVLEELMLSAKWDLLGEPQKQQLMRLWEAFATQLQQAQAPPQPATPGQTPGAAAGSGAPIGANPSDQFTGASGAQELEQQATAAMERSTPPGAQARA